MATLSPFCPNLTDRSRGALDAGVRVDDAPAGVDDAVADQRCAAVAFGPLKQPSTIFGGWPALRATTYTVASAIPLRQTYRLGVKD